MSFIPANLEPIMDATANASSDAAETKYAIWKAAELAEVVVDILKGTEWEQNALRMMAAINVAEKAAVKASETAAEASGKVNDMIQSALDNTP